MGFIVKHFSMSKFGDPRCIGFETSCGKKADIYRLTAANHKHATADGVGKEKYHFTQSLKTQSVYIMLPLYITNLFANFQVMRLRAVSGGIHDRRHVDT